MGALALICCAAPLMAQTGAKGGQWRHYGGDQGSSRYSRLSQINRNNAAKLSIRWRWLSPDENIDSVENQAFEATPLMIGGVLYTSTS